MSEMEEYQLEIDQLRSTLEHAKMDELEPDLIEEYAAELRNLTALFEAAKVVFSDAENDSRIPRALDLVGYGEFTFDNVYSFVYDAALAAELEGRELSTIINQTDYSASLVAIFE